MSAAEGEELPPGDWGAGERGIGCIPGREEEFRAGVAKALSYATRLGELEVLSAARIADLLAPGQVLLRLAVAGFGVSLPPPATRA